MTIIQTLPRFNHEQIAVKSSVKDVHAAWESLQGGQTECEKKGTKRKGGGGGGFSESGRVHLHITETSCTMTTTVHFCK